jgi:hypothetical protein
LIKKDTPPMAKKANNVHKNTLKKKQVEKSDLEGHELSWDVVHSSLKSQRLKKIAGFFLLLLSVFMFLSFASYLFTWKSYDAWLDGMLFNWSFLSDPRHTYQQYNG